MRPRLLVLSATQGEVAPLVGALGVPERSPSERPGRPAPWWDRRELGVLDSDVVFVTTGIGKTNAAAAAALALAEFAPSHVLLVGIGGAYPGASLEVGSVALAMSETHVDSGVGHGASWEGLDAIGFPLLATDPVSYNRLWFDQRFIGRLALELRTKAVPFATTDSMTAEVAHGRWLAARHGVVVESMEGAAVAQVALAFGVPLVEVRGISHVIGVRDKARWDVKSAVTSACGVAERALALLAAA